MISAILTVFFFLPFYLLGTIPFGVLIARRLGVDITSTGSGNIGAANVARTLGLKAGLLTLLGDALKGSLAVWLAMLCTSNVLYHSLAGLASVAGHCFSIPSRLKGGKGVASTLGAALVLNPAAAGFGVLIYGICFWWFRIPSVASLGGVMLAPLFSFMSGTRDEVSFTLSAMALLVLFRHRENLKRLVEGREKRFSPAKKQQDGNL